MSIRKGVWDWILQWESAHVLEEKINKAKKENRYLAIFDNNKEEQEYFESEFEKKKLKEKEEYRPSAVLI
jgi:hypothetical protein